MIIKSGKLCYSSSCERKNSASSLLCTTKLFDGSGKNTSCKIHLQPSTNVFLFVKLKMKSKLTQVDSRSSRILNILFSQEFKCASDWTSTQNSSFTDMVNVRVRVNNRSCFFLSSGVSRTISYKCMKCMKYELMRMMNK